MPSTLRECSFKISYGPADDRLNDFYVPALSVSVRYDRAAGFFSSTALSVAAQGIARLIQNGGRMRLLVGAELSEDDVEAIRKGTELAERLSERLLASLTDPVDELQQRRLEALAWMVADGTLDMKVVLPKGPDGRPLPADQAADYYHPKEGIFTDAAGDQVAFSGSVNESRTAWQNNYEQFAVYKSWDASRPYLMQAVYRFERLWQGQERDWVAVTVPEAVRQHLVRYRPSEAPRYDPLERVPTRVREGEVEYRPRFRPSQRERIIFQFLRDAPYLFNAGDLSTATSAVEPWPHQRRVVEDVVSRFPESFLLCDEVGLGKTIEAGLILRQLWLTGRVRRCLLLVPKSIARQWQEELYEKFVLNIPFYDGFRLTDYFEREVPVSTSNPWDAAPLMLASSQLAKRRERRQDLIAAEPWDLVIVDEAHHARRREFLSDRYRPNRLLELLTALKDRTRCLLFLTATPMQISPVEVWDLLKLLGLGGRWGAGDRNFLRFFEELRKPDGERDWAFLSDLYRDYLESGGRLDTRFAEAAQARLGPVEWQALASSLASGDGASPIRRLSDSARAVAAELLRRHTPLQTFLHRNTRSLLRRYQELGLLREKVPFRHPEPVWITMRPDERTLYDRVEEYISHFYERYERERKGLGFVMTVYRRRLTSSFYALEQSLRRRLAFLRGEGEQAGLDDDDLEQADLNEDVAEDLEGVDRGLFRAEATYVEDFLHELGHLQGDSKFERLCADLTRIFQKRETVVLFTQYTDTMDYLRDKLRDVYGARVACYSGRGGEYWNGLAWIETTKELIKNQFREGTIKVLVCTEAASEGLNLQTCGVLINYDMPWNPMRVEQRIGRIDRIGQVHDDVWVSHYFYEDTVEAIVYGRLADRIGWFETVVGELQPILARVGRVIERLAITSRQERERRLDEELASLRQDIEARGLADLDLDRYTAAEPSAPRPSRTPVSLSDLEQVLCNSEALGGSFRHHPSIEGAYLLSWEGTEQPVTFRRDVFEQHPITMRLLSYGDEVFTSLLESVETPEEGAEGPVCRARAEVNTVQVTGFFTQEEGHAQPVESISNLSTLTDWRDALQPTEIEEARRATEDAASESRDRVVAVQRRKRSAAYKALEEEGRQTLLRAAYIELALSQRPELGAEPAVPEFSVEAVRRLARHRYPFAGLLALVPLDGLRPSPADPEYLQLRGASPESLRGKFEAEKQRAASVLRELARWQEEATTPREPRSSVQVYIVTTA
jgi:superfamily II DNA or RNA helicase